MYHSTIHWLSQNNTIIKIHYEKKWLRGCNSVNKQGRIMLCVPCPSAHCHLSINQVSFQSLLYFPRYGLDRHQLWKTKWLWGDNPVDIQCWGMGFVNCPSPYYMTFIYYILHKMYPQTTSTGSIEHTCNVEKYESEW